MQLWTVFNITEKETERVALSSPAEKHVISLQKCTFICLESSGLFRDFPCFSLAHSRLQLLGSPE